jgi:hypothetical protein
MTNDLLLDLIRRYIDLARDYALQLRQELKHDDLLTAVNAGTIARNGTLATGARYEFHGVGCDIHDWPLEFDFDFGPRGRSDGFDAWRLHRLAAQLPGFDSLCDPSVIERGLHELERRGLLRKPEWPPSPHLLYLSEPT